ncbi:PorV/PorQ family protein [bacterium]|nr:PorV/PorQ family protein [bacterium]
MKKLFMSVCAAAVIGLVATATFADQTNFDIGKVGGSELKIGLGPRPVAMGEAFVAKADDANATYWNPAGLGQIQGYHASFMHNIYLEDTSLEYLAYAQNLFEGAGIGANLMILNFGSMDKVDIDSSGLPVIVSEFTPMVFSFAVGYGQFVMPFLSVGGSVKFISQNIDTESYSAVALDIGAIFQLKAKGDNAFQAGLAIQNLGSSLGEASLPMNAKAGLAYSVPFKITEKDTWNILLDINLPFGDVNYTSANIGTEYCYNDLIAVRGGYKIKDTGDLSGMAGLTAGLGVKVPVGQSIAMHIDYALLSFGDLGLTHQIALTAVFK